MMTQKDLFIDDFTDEWIDEEDDLFDHNPKDKIEGPPIKIEKLTRLINERCLTIESLK